MIAILACAGVVARSAVECLVATFRKQLCSHMVGAEFEGVRSGVVLRVKHKLVI